MITCHKCNRQFKTMQSPLYCSCGAITHAEFATSKPSPKQKSNVWIKWVKPLRKPEDKGVGDTVARIAAKLGGERFKAFSKRIGLPCGCTQRQESWNKLYPY